MANFIFDYRQTPREIIVEAPTTDVTVQEIYDAAREWEASPTGCLYPRIFDGSGKETLSATKSVGITATMRDWKIRFANRSGPTWTHCSISGGNLVYLNTSTTTYGTPLADTQGAYTTVSLELDTSAALLVGGAALTQDDLDNLAAAVWNSIAADFQTIGTTGYWLFTLVQLLGYPYKVSESGSKVIIYDTDEVTPIYEVALLDKDGNSIVLQGTGPASRGKLVSI